MRRILLGSAIAVHSLLAGCASIPMTSGRYLQVRHAVSDSVVLQLVLPTKEGCATALRSMAFANEQTRQAQPYTSCREPSASGEMRAIATLRDKTGNYIFEVETIVLSICQAYVSEALKISKDAIDVVSDCKTK